MKVTVEFDEDQVHVINNALELYCRMCMGQIDYLPHLIDRWYLTEQVRLDLAHLKESMFPELEWNSSWGIAQEQSGKKAHIAWDVFQQLRHDISWKRFPEGGMTVNFDRPLQICMEHRLPKVIIED